MSWTNCLLIASLAFVALVVLCTAIPQPRNRRRTDVLPPPSDVCQRGTREHYITQLRTRS